MKVASFYRFLDLDEPGRLRGELQGACGRLALLGTVLVAAEGVNGTVSGSDTAIRGLLGWLESRLELDSPIETLWSDAAEAPFSRLRIRLKPEIVALGRPDIRPQRRTGTHVSPAGWNRLLDDPDVVVVDTRNRYEFEVGTFPRAVDPGTDRFREFPDFAADLAKTAAGRPLAMFCTGGIRCEKASALMLELGFDTVYHLQGGILKYLEEIPAAENRWQGECFVFDKRVAVDRELAEGEYVQCHACRRPLGAADLASPDYREGVSCPKCIHELDAGRAASLEERRKQVKIAKARGLAHIGPGVRRPDPE